MKPSVSKWPPLCIEESRIAGRGDRRENKSVPFSQKISPSPFLFSSAAECSSPVVADERPRPDLGAVDHGAAFDRGDTFSGAAAALRRGIRDEVFDRAVARAADANAALPFRVSQVAAIVRAVA